MSNNNPNQENLHRQKAKWVTAQGQTVECKTIRVPVYLADSVLAIAMQIHEEAQKKAQEQT